MSSLPLSEALIDNVDKVAEELPKCSSAFDALYFCMTPGNQFRKYYREGTYDDCESAQNYFYRAMLPRPLLRLSSTLSCSRFWYQGIYPRQSC